MARIALRWRLVTMLVVALLDSPLAAAPPLLKLVPFKKIDADPKKSYKLTKSSGPWMIMAISFGGDEAEEQARKLVLELRKDHQLEAWMHEQEVDLSEPVIGLGVDKYGNPRKMKHAHGGTSREFAVLLGNFKSADDPDAVRMLERIRTAKVKCLTTGQVAQKSEYRIRDAYLAFSQKQKAKTRGPLGRAFITRNPLLPPDQFAKQTLDPFVVELNQGVPYSLLENPAQYTVVVATYRGAAAYSEQDFEKSVKKSFASNQDAQIDKAAKDATLLVEELRRQKVEAYIFHDRHESLVTVGAFNDIGNEEADGHIELQPAIAAVIKKFEAQKSSLTGATSTNPEIQLASNQVGLIPKTYTVKTSDGRKHTLTLDVSPRLIQVPRRSIADVYR
jgi:hypothetical protein